MTVQPGDEHPADWLDGYNRGRSDAEAAVRRLDARERQLAERILALNSTDMSDDERRDAEDAGERLAEIVLTRDQRGYAG